MWASWRRKRGIGRVVRGLTYVLCTRTLSSACAVSTLRAGDAGHGAGQRCRNRAHGRTGWDAARSHCRDAGRSGLTKQNAGQHGTLSKVKRITEACCVLIARSWPRVPSSADTTQARAHARQFARARALQHARSVHVTARRRTLRQRLIAWLYFTRIRVHLTRFVRAHVTVGWR